MKNMYTSQHNRSNLLQLGVGGNDIPKKAPLTLMKYKCFFAGYQKPAKLVKAYTLPNLYFDLIARDTVNPDLPGQLGEAYVPVSLPLFLLSGARCEVESGGGVLLFFSAASLQSADSFVCRVSSPEAEFMNVQFR